MGVELDGASAGTNQFLSAMFTIFARTDAKHQP